MAALTRKSNGSLNKLNRNGPARMSIFQQTKQHKAQEGQKKQVNTGGHIPGPGPCLHMQMRHIWKAGERRAMAESTTHNVNTPSSVHVCVLMYYTVHGHNATKSGDRVTAHLCCPCRNPQNLWICDLTWQKGLGIIIQLRIFEKREAPELFRCHQEGPYKKRVQRLESREEIMTMEMEAKQNSSEGSCKWWGQAASVSWETQATGSQPGTSEGTEPYRNHKSPLWVLWPEP